VSRQAGSLVSTNPSIHERQRAHVPAGVVVHIHDPTRPIEPAAAARHHCLRLALSVQPHQHRIGYTPAGPIEHGMVTVGTMKPVKPGWHWHIPILSTGLHRVGKRFRALIDLGRPKLSVPFSF
jgi:hypothetical protein